MFGIRLKMIPMITDQNERSWEEPRVRIVIFPMAKRSPGAPRMSNLREPPGLFYRACVSVGVAQVHDKNVSATLIAGD